MFESQSTEFLLVPSTGFLSAPCENLSGMSEPKDRLKEAREKAGFASASAAAKRFGWKISTYLSHENGQTEEIPPKTARKYAKAFKVSAAWLQHEEGDMRPVIAKGRLDRALKSVPAELQPEAIRYLEFLAAQAKR
jgi:transcriptional regulator with XRE-family HTH domain